VIRSIFSPRTRLTSASRMRPPRRRSTSMTTIRIRRFAAFIFAGAALAMAALAQAQQKLVLYTSNESTLNEFAAAAFNRETGIKVDIVSAGSGVIIKRLQAEKDRPQG